MAPKIATLMPALEERPPGPASFNRFSVIRGRNRSGLSSCLLELELEDDVDDDATTKGSYAGVFVGSGRDV